MDEINLARGGSTYAPLLGFYQAIGNKGRRREVDLSWNGSIPHTIRGRMKKAEYS